MLIIYIISELDFHKMEGRKGGGGGEKQQKVKGKKIGFKHKKNMGKKPVFKKKKENKSSQLKAAVEKLTSQYETIEAKNVKKFR